MAKIRGIVTIEQERCKVALEVNGKGYHYAKMANPDACTGCTSCALMCPDCCITVYRQKDSND